MKKARFLSRITPVAIVAVMLSCSSDEAEVRIEKATQNEANDNGEQLPDVEADRMLVVELEGMVCEMGCGGSIRKELYASNAVETVSFEFDENKAVDIARVAYDRNKISADEILGIITTTNDGQFDVVDSSSEPYVSVSYKDEPVENSKAEKSKSKVSIKTSSYSSMSGSLFDLFSWL